MKEVSIIIPVYNGEKFIGKCLNSVLKEKVSKEIIIINDGSTDGTKEIITSLMAKNQDIILINQKNRGQGYARNIGIEKAIGKYVIFVDADDWINKGSIDRAVFLAEKDNLDILYWNIDWVYDNGNIKHVSILPPIYKNYDDKGYILSDPSPCNKLIRTNILKKNKIRFPIDCIYEDFALIPSLVKYTKNIKFTEKITYNYYQRANSTMNQSEYNPKFMDLIKAYDHLYSKVMPDYKAELEYLSIMQLIYFRTFELLKYNKKQEIKECISHVNTLFPNWKDNKYFKMRNILIKIYCYFIEKKFYLLCKVMVNIRNMIRRKM